MSGSPRGALGVAALLALGAGCDPRLPPRCVTALDAVAPEAAAAHPLQLRLAERLGEAAAILEAQAEEPWLAVEALERWRSGLSQADRRLARGLRSIERSDPAVAAEVTAYVADAQLRLDEALVALGARDPAAAQAAAAVLLSWLEGS